MVWRFRILECILTSALLNNGLESNLAISMWKVFKVSLRWIYISFVIYCNVKEKYLKSKKITKCQRPLDTVVNEAQKMFKNLFPMIQISNSKCVLQMFTYGMLWKNFR